MKTDLNEIFKALGWSLGLVAVFASVLSLFGVALDMVLTIAGAMVGAQALISLTIDVLKWAGVINDGNAGKWSAGLNLFGLAGIAVALGLYPNFDFPKLDAQFVVIAQFASLVFAYVVQIAGTKRAHQLTVRGFGFRALSYSSK